MLWGKGGALILLPLIIAIWYCHYGEPANTSTANHCAFNSWFAPSCSEHTSRSAQMRNTFSFCGQTTSVHRFSSIRVCVCASHTHTHKRVCFAIKVQKKALPNFQWLSQIMQPCCRSVAICCNYFNVLMINGVFSTVWHVKWVENTTLMICPVL